jgi:hypothetical protein
MISIDSRYSKYLIWRKYEKYAEGKVDQKSNRYKKETLNRQKSELHQSRSRKKTK